MPKIGGARSGATGAKNTSRSTCALGKERKKNSSHTLHFLSAFEEKYKYQTVTEIINSSKETGWAQKTHTREMSEPLFKQVSSIVCQ